MAAVLGWIVLLAAAVAAAAGAAGAGRRWRRERRTLEAESAFLDGAVRDLREKVERERVREGAWGGFRKFMVTRRRDAARGVVSLEMRPHDGHPAPPFVGGQFLTFRLKTGEDRMPATRCYSLSDGPREDGCYQITVKRVSPPGEVSSYFHDHVREGDILDVGAPAGDFTLEKSGGRPVVMIAGGVGITPFLSMLSAMAAAGDAREAWLFYGVRCAAEHVAADRLRELRDRLPGLRMVVFYSAPESAGERAECDVVGRVDADAVKRRLPSCNYEFHICGPSAMLDKMVADLKEWGARWQSVRYEAFGKASVKKRRVTDESGERHKITFAKSGVSVMWTPSMGAILDVCEQNGVSAESGCRAGNCRACMTPVRAGEVRYISRPGCVPEAGSCLICCSVPGGDLTIDL